MSSNASIDDLEEGEIEDNLAFEPRFGHNLTPNETMGRVDRSGRKVSPMFRSVLTDSPNSLFGLSDVDLRFDNRFSDCDDRVVASNPPPLRPQRHPNVPTFMTRNINPMNPRLRSPFEPPFCDNRYGSRPPMRPPMCSFPPPFRPNNQMPYQTRQLGQMSSLLPTPAHPLRHLPPIHSFLPIRPSISQPFDGSNYQHSPQQSMSFMSNSPTEGVTHTSVTEPQCVNSFVIPNTSHSTIPLICDPNDTSMQTLQSGQTTEEVYNTEVTNFLNSLNNKTIVLETANDIEEVEMSDQSNDADLSPYDPEEDITNLCRLSPIKDTKLIDSTSDTKISFSNESDGKEERLKRLLKSVNSSKTSETNKRSGSRSKTSSKRFKPMQSQPSDGECLSPVRKSSSKNLHSINCRKSGHKSRRKVKQMAKKRVVIVGRGEQSVGELRPKSMNSMKESSYEDLLEEYDRLKEQLKELESEEKVNVVTIIDKEEEENIAKFVTNKDDMFGMSNESKDNINRIEEEGEVNEEEDDEEGEEIELRRLALESKKKRELAEQENEELKLRQQLLKSLFKSKAKPNSPIVVEKESKEEVNELNVENLITLNEQISSEELNTDLQTTVNMTADIESIVKTIEPLKQISKLIINFGEDSTDDEQESSLSVTNIPKGLDSFLRQARLRSETKTKASQPLPVLSITKQRELQQLKAEIHRRELNQVNDKKLKENELLLKSSKEKLTEKMSKKNLLKTRVTLKRNALRKAQIQARKMQEAFIAATRVVSATASEFHSFNDELKNIEKDVKQEIQNIANYKKECLRMGTKLQGNTYKLPIAVTFKRSNSLSTSSSPNKKDTKLENNSLSKEELLLKLENCSKLLDLKKANLLRPSSPNPYVLKNTQNFDTNNDKNDCQKNLQLLAKDLLKINSNDWLMSYQCFLENMFLSKCQPNVNINIAEIDSQLSNNYKTESFDNTYDSVLSHLHSYRLIENQPKNISSDHWTNNLNPLQEICKFDLLGTCNDEKCLGQHISKNLLNPTNKLVDLLLYEPKIAGITAEIPDHIPSELYEAIKQRLQQFAQKLIDSHPKLSLEIICRKIAEQIRRRTKQSPVCQLTRRIPKQFNTFRIDVPFDDLMYRFNIRDKTLIINKTKISELKLSADPDIYIKNRFYAPEGVPISAQLETTLASDPKNIQLWIKLAYYYISRCADHPFADSIDGALNVLSRALEQNKSEPELWEHYLFIYSNRIVKKGEDSRFDLKNICLKAVEHCPHYRVWKCILSLFISFTDKITLSNQLLNNLLNNSLFGVDDFDDRSHQILEIFLFKIHLNLQQNSPKESVEEFIRALDATFDDTTHNISKELTISDRVFAWICFTYLLINNNMPNHCFELSNQGFPELINKSVFIFDWMSLKNKFNLNEMKAHLNKAVEQCEVNDENALIVNQDSYAIHLNLAELYLVCESDHKYYDYLIEITKHHSILGPLIVERRFNANKNYSNLIETLKQSSVYANEDNMRIRYTVAKHYARNSQNLDAINELLSIVSNYYDNCMISITNIKQAFEALLLEAQENNPNFELINCRNAKEFHFSILWLSYILYLEMDYNSSQQIEAAFQTALALSSVDGSDSKDLQLLWSNYLEFAAKNIENEKQFMDLFESVRHCCLTINDSTFQLQVIKFLCQMLSPNEKSKALIQFVKLLPQNLDITLTAIYYSLQIDQKERVWLLINSIVFDKKIRFKSVEFWKIAIGLAIERSDHLSVHKFFQISISIMPYNSILWQNFKTYETSIRHSEHLKQAKDICDKQLNISPFL